MFHSKHPVTPRTHTAYPAVNTNTLPTRGTGKHSQFFDFTLVGAALSADPHMFTKYEVTSCSSRAGDILQYQHQYQGKPIIQQPILFQKQKY